MYLIHQGRGLSATAARALPGSGSVDLDQASGDLSSFAGKIPFPHGRFSRSQQPAQVDTGALLAYPPHS
jgi:hypothetical protein